MRIVMDYLTQTERFILARTCQSSTRILTLDRPNKRNALCQTLIDELLQQLKIASADPHIRAIVIAGSGAIFSGRCLHIERRQHVAELPPLAISIQLVPTSKRSLSWMASLLGRSGTLKTSVMG